MADKFEKKLNDAIEEVVKGYKKAATVAAAKATEKTADAIYNRALSCLEEYYNSYRPTSYDRTYTLSWAFVKDYKVSQNKSGQLVCKMGVIYDPTKLDGFYWKKRGPNYNSYIEPDSQWIIDNYLNGLHPSTSGGATMQYGLNYEAKTGMFGEQSPTHKMDAFLDWKAKKEFEGWFWQSLLEQTLNSIK